MTPLKEGDRRPHLRMTDLKSVAEAVSPDLLGDAALWVGKI